MKEYELNLTCFVIVHPRFVIPEPEPEIVFLKHEPVVRIKN